MLNSLRVHLKMNSIFLKVRGIMNTSGSRAKFLAKLLLTLQETRSIHDSMNLQKIEFIANIYILYK